MKIRFGMFDLRRMFDRQVRILSFLYESDDHMTSICLIVMMDTIRV